MTVYGLVTHELDPARATGIARYSQGLAEALPGILHANDRAPVVTARGCGQVRGEHVEIGVRRRYLYAGWLFAGLPRVEWLVPSLDLVHVTAPVVPVPTGRPLVVTVHDLLPLTHPQWYPPREVAVFRRCVKWIERKAAAVVVPTSTVARDLARMTAFPESRVFVTGEGVDLDRFALGASGLSLDDFQLRAGDYLLYVGQVSARKNLTTLLSALAPDDPPLLLAGPDGFGADEVHAAAAANPRVRFLGRVTDEQLARLVRGARALVHPSRYEGFGLTAVEAMAVGTPVVVSGAGSLPEVVGDGGYIVAGDDVDAWRAALAYLRVDEHLEHLQKIGPPRAAEWSWSVTAARTLRAYEAALAHV